MAKEKEDNPFIGIPAALSGIYLVIVIMFLVFAKDQLNYLIYILLGFVGIGVIALVLAYKSKKK